MRRTKPYLFVVTVLALLGDARGAEAQQKNLSDTEWIKPLVMLLVDTSGSMERRIDESGQPTDRTPDCSSSTPDVMRSRWAMVTEALTGEFSTGFTCKAESRRYVASDATTWKYNNAYDQNYFIPHIQYSFTSQGTGFLDRYADTVKFGLMTFDGLSTTVSGATLVPWDQYGTDATLRSNINGQPGMWSYPTTTASLSTTAQTPLDAFGWKPLAFPGCTAVYGVNVGARAADPNNVAITDLTGMPGALLGPPASEDATTVKNANNNIQESLLRVRPYGGTPIAAMLDDFRYFLRTDTTSTVRQGTDTFFSCRKRYGLLLTDGAPDSLYRDSRFNCAAENDPTCPETSPGSGVRRCQCPYDEAYNIAEKLVTRDGLDTLWVVAFNVDSVALNQLNQIARYGSKNANDALPARTSAQLIAALETVMAAARPPSTSRSVPVVVNTGRPVTLKGAQYVITAGFQVGASETDPWQGRLFRQRVECVDSVPTTQALDTTQRDLFHIDLSQMSDTDRNILTIRPNLSAVAGNLFATTSDPGLVTNTDNTVTGLLGQIIQSVIEVVKVLLGISTTQTPTSQYNLAVTQFDKTLSPTYFATTTTTYRDTIVDYTRGASANRKDAKLADIVHSNPAVVPPLAAGSDLLNTFDPTLRAYYNDLLSSTKYGTAYGSAGRPGVVYVATNDGVLHAFSLENWSFGGTTYKTGQEIWGFVPPVIFSAMKMTPGAALFDGSPVVKDVMFSSRTPKMGTVLVAPLRSDASCSAPRCAAAYIALDVTRPEAPKFLWQRTFGPLGKTVATPAIAHVRIKLANGTTDTRAVVIMPGGKGNEQASTTGCDVNDYNRGTVPYGGRTKVRCWDSTGRGLYVVDALTGALIQQFDARHFPSPMTGSVVVDSDGIGLTRAAYMTDEDGVLWRLSMMNTGTGTDGGDPSVWRVAPIWDLFQGTLPGWLPADGPKSVVGTPALAGRVSSYPPVLVRDPKTANLTIIVGTGDVDDLVNAKPNRVVSLQETRATDSTKELMGTQTGGIKLNWGIQLDAYESVTGPISVLDDVAYFTTFTGPSDATQCLVGGSKIVGAAVRTKDADGLPLGQINDEANVLRLWYQPIAAPQALLLGLNVSPDPVCIKAGSKDSDLFASGFRATDIASTSRSSYQLRTMVAGQGGTDMAGSTAGGVGAQKALSRSISTPNVARSVGWASSIE